MNVPGPYPYHGEIEWLSREEGGRQKLPVLPMYAAVGWREDVGIDGTASFVLRGFDPASPRSRSDGRWLVPQPDGRFQVSVGDVVVIAEGRRPVGRFIIDAVDASPEH